MNCKISQNCKSTQEVSNAFVGLLEMVHTGMASSLLIQTPTVVQFRNIPFSRVNGSNLRGSFGILEGWVTTGYPVLPKSSPEWNLICINSKCKNIKSGNFLKIDILFYRTFEHLI